MKAKSEKSKGKMLLGEFLEKHYCHWLEIHHKTGRQTINILQSTFQFLLNQPVDEIKILDIEKWRTQRQEEGIKAATLNRQIVVLKSALNWGIEHGLVKSNPLDHLKRLHEYNSNKERVRYLTDYERTRLLTTLDAREVRIRAARVSHNKWLTERGQESLPTLDGEFVDHLKPLVLLALNLGIRKSYLFSLKWRDLDFDKKKIYLPVDREMNPSKNHIYMNETALEILTAWHRQSADTSPNTWVFPSSKRNDCHIASIQHSWKGVLNAAQIENFCFHDLRHDFTFQLIIKRVDLNIVRDILGHAKSIEKWIA